MLRRCSRRSARLPVLPSQLSSADQLAATYRQALAYITSGGDPSLKKPTQAQQLAFYGLYKQEEKGKCTEKAPSRLNVIARAKWDAWNKLGSMSREDAQRAYIAALTKSDPTWAEKVKIKSKL